LGLDAPHNRRKTVNKLWRLWASAAGIIAALAVIACGNWAHSDEAPPFQFGISGVNERGDSIRLTTALEKIPNAGVIWRSADRRYAYLGTTQQTGSSFQTYFAHFTDLFKPLSFPWEPPVHKQATGSCPCCPPSDALMTETDSIPCCRCFSEVMDKVYSAYDSAVLRLPHQIGPIVVSDVSFPGQGEISVLSLLTLTTSDQAALPMVRLGVGIDGQITWEKPQPVVRHTEREIHYAYLQGRYPVDGNVKRVTLHIESVEPAGVVAVGPRYLQVNYTPDLDAVFGAKR
jgi:hypothetical protein